LVDEEPGTFVETDSPIRRAGADPAPETAGGQLRLSADIVQFLLTARGGPTAKLPKAEIHRQIAEERMRN